jgi:PAS domain S-box-containing protein
MVLGRDAAIAALATYHDRLAEVAPERFEAAFRDSPAGVGAHEIDSEGVLRRVNPEELRLLGYTEDQMVGRPVSDFIVLQEASRRAIAQRLEGSRDTKPFLRAFRKADGSAITMLLMVRVIRDERGGSWIRTVMTEAELTGE